MKLADGPSVKEKRFATAAAEGCERSVETILVSRARIGNIVRCTATQIPAKETHPPLLHGRRLRGVRDGIGRKGVLVCAKRYFVLCFLHAAWAGGFRSERVERAFFLGTAWPCKFVAFAVKPARSPLAFIWIAS